MNVKRYNREQFGTNFIISTSNIYPFSDTKSNISRQKHSPKHRQKFKTNEIMYFVKAWNIFLL